MFVWTLFVAADRSAATGSFARIIAVLLLPAAFVVFGGWEVVRGNATTTELTRAHDRGAIQLGRLETLAKTDPHAMIQFRGDNQSYAAPLAATMMADHQNDVATDLWIATARRPFAWLAITAGLVALCAGLIGLGIVAVAARRSMQSRTALVRAFERVRRAIPFALGLQTAGIALALFGSVVFECGGLWFLGEVSGNLVKLVALGLAAAGLALWGAFGSIRQLRRAFGLFKPRPARLLGIPIAEAAAPGLFALMRHLARDQEAVVPEIVVAGAVAGFFVTSYPQALPASGAVVRGRTLHVSLPHLAVLSRAETRVILAHELAHFSGEDTAYSMQFQPVYAALQHSTEAVAGRAGSMPIVDRMLRPAASLGGYVLDRFDRAVKHWSRLRELEADRSALATEQPDALATSLLRTAVVSEIVDVQLRGMTENPAGAPADFVAQTLHIAAQKGFIEPGRYLSERQPHPTDTHPPTTQRIEAAGIAVDDGLLARASRAVDPAELADAEALFTNWPGLCRAVTSQLSDLAVALERKHLARTAAAATAVSEAPVALHEPRRYILITLSVTALFCFLVGGGLVWLLRNGSPEAGDGTDTVLIWGAVAFVLGGVAAFVGLVRFARNRAPFLVLTPDGFRSPGFEGAVPWLAVTSVLVVAGRGVTTILTLAPDQPLPARTGRIWRLRTRRRGNKVVLSGLTPQGMKPKAYLDLLHRYRSAALARAELARRERPAVHSAE